MDGRFFGGRRLSAELYDGKTRYDAYKSGKAGESEQEEKDRLDRYAAWLEGRLDDNLAANEPGGGAPRHPQSSVAPFTGSLATTPPLDKVIQERDDEIGERERIEMDLKGVRETSVEEELEGEESEVAIPEGAFLLPGGGWALPPSKRRLDGEEDEDAALEAGDDEP